MTKKLEKEFWSNTEQLLQTLLDDHSDRLDCDSKAWVQHYLDHSEYEMAFEGLFIELMKLDPKPMDINFRTFIELGKTLGLEKDSVLDADFWSKFMQFTLN